jgi:hypothetical protein
MDKGAMCDFPMGWRLGSCNLTWSTLDERQEMDLQRGPRRQRSDQTDTNSENEVVLGKQKGASMSLRSLCNSGRVAIAERVVEVEELAGGVREVSTGL